MPTILAAVTVGPIDTTPGPPVKPDATNTGYAPTGVTLTPYPATGGPAGNIVNGRLAITGANLTLDSYDFACQVAILATNVTIKRSLIRGSALVTAVSAGVLDCVSASCSNALIQDCTVVPDVPHSRWTGIIGHNYTARRCNATRSVDSTGIFNTSSANPVNVLLESCWLHGHSYFSPDAQHPNDLPVSHSHADGCQIQGGSGSTLRYCNIEGYCDTTVKSADGSSTSDILRSSSNPNSLGGYNTAYPRTQSNSGVQVTQPGQNNPSKVIGALVSNVTIDSCWLSGGAATVNFGAGNYANVRIVNNRFAVNSGGYYILFPAAETTAVITGNIFDVTGAPVTVTRF